MKKVCYGIYVFVGKGVLVYIEVDNLRLSGILIVTMIVVINAWFRPKKDEPQARLFSLHMLIIISHYTI